MVSKENVKLVSKLKKNMSILCPLITSTLLYLVKALHGRCPYHCIMQKMHKSFNKVMSFNKVKNFHCSVQNIFQVVRHSIGSKSLSWMLQCTQVALGATACTRITAPLSPCHGFAPSVQIPTHLDQVHLMSQSCPVL